MTAQPNPQTRRGADFSKPVIIAVPPIILTVAIWRFITPEMLPRDTALAAALLIIPWWAWRTWKASPTTLLPLFAMISFMHWVYFGLPLFHGPSNFAAAPWAVSAAVAMAVIGVIFLWLGMKVPVRLFRPASLPDIPFDRRRWNYLRFLIVLGIVMAKSADAYLLGEGGRQIILIIQNVAPATAFAMLYRAWLQGRLRTSDKFLVAGYAAALIVFGLSSGWSGAAVFVFMVSGLTWISVRRRLPLAAMALLLPCLVFLQAGKGAFRSAYWYTEGAGGGIWERTSFWLSQSTARWSEALHSPDPDDARNLVMNTLDRASLLSQAAHVLELTPGKVPYQGGKTYSYMLVTLIPRFMWPDKPSVNDANRFYQVAYGLTSEQDLDHVSISVGFLTEGFINFGWFGVVAVMFLIGIALGTFERTFLSPDSGSLLPCLGFVLVVSLLGVEFQLAQYLSGLIQRIMLPLAIMLPVTRRLAGNAGRLPAAATPHAVSW
jgi:hypothetical protein